MCGALHLLVGSAFAGAEATHASGWTAWRWTSEDGLPLDDVTAVDFGPGGIAWIATFDGLARFDGSTFDVHRPSTHPGLPTARIVDLAVTGDGSRWLVTETGELVRGDRSGYQLVPRAETGVGQARELLRLDGRLWLVGSSGVASIEGLGVTPVELKGLPPGSTFRQASPTWQGNLLINTQEGPLLSVQPATGQVHVVHPRTPTASSQRQQEGGGPQHARTYAMIGDDALIVGRGQLLRVPPTGEPRVLAESPGFLRLLQSRSGQITAITPEGAYQITDAGLAPLTGPLPGEPGEWWVWDRTLYRGSEPVFVGEKALSLLQVDAESGAWVAEMGSGLLYVHPSAVSSLQRDEHGLIGPVNTVLADRDGGLWIAAENGLRRRQGGRSRLVVDEQGDAIRDALALLQRRNGTVWVSSARGACRVHDLSGDAALRCASAGDGVVWTADIAMIEGPDGSVWSGSGILVRQREGGPFEGVVRPEGWQPFRDIAVTADGAILASSIGTGLWRVSGDDVEQRTGAPGGPLRSVRTIVLDERGDAWLGTEGLGLCRLQLSAGPFAEAPLRCIGAADGLADPFVNSLASDGQGRLWMSSNRGLHGVRWEALLEHLEGRLEPLPMISLGRHDGMAEPETNGVRKPSVARTADGALWYPTMNGVARLDPAAVESPEPPPVVIESLRSPARDLLAEAEPIELGPAERELDVRWTVAAFHHPDAVRFRYRLAGLDDGWRGPTDARTATWTNLPPGRYTFEVQSGWSGRWREPQAVATIAVRPTFRETPTFWLAVAALILLLGIASAGVRGRQLRRRAGELERAVEVATRELEAKNSRIAAQSELLQEQNARVAAQAERLEHLDQVRTRFVANISHELRTPTTLILGALQVSGEQVPGSVHPPLEVARRNAERLAELIEQLLDVARLDAGGVPLRARRVELARWLARVTERFEAAAAARQVTLKLDAEAPVEAWIDPDLLEKVLSNLLGNGLDYCPPGGQLLVSLTTDGDADVGQAVVRVTDSGPGVPAPLRERLFDRFYQVDDSDQRARGGAGIGLSLSREFVQLHGGSIDVEDTDGPGATFRVRLPLGSAHLAITEVQLSPDSSLPPTSALLPPGPPPEPIRAEGLPLALVVEDHPDMRAFVAEQLTAAFQVVTAVDGQDALDQLREGLSPQVVVTDVMMPRLDGLGLCRALRQDPRWAKLPVLVLSAKATEADTVAGLNVADDYLSKPFRSSELVLRARKLAARDSRVVTPEEPAVASAFVEKLVAIAREHIADSSFGVAQLAKQAALSARQLQRRLREELGESPAAWLRTQRLEAARELMGSGRVETVGEAAAAVGMSRSYLARVYQDWAGRSPSEDLQRPGSGLP